MRTSTCYVVILMIFGMRLATTNTTIRPKTPPGVGSCRPISPYDLQVISSIVMGQPVAVIRHRAVCTVPGVTRNTVSQYAMFVQIVCYNCDERFHYFRYNLMCHNSTESFLDPTIMAYRGVTTVRGDTTDFFYTPSSGINCGRCADLDGRPDANTCYGIILYYYRFELWLISNSYTAVIYVYSVYKQSTCYRFKEHKATF